MNSCRNVGIIENYPLLHTYLIVGLSFMFQKDNVAAHTSRVVMDWPESFESSMINWPACSPDVSPIEKV